MCICTSPCNSIPYWWSELGSQLLASFPLFAETTGHPISDVWWSACLIHIYLDTIHIYTQTHTHKHTHTNKHKTRKRTRQHTQARTRTHARAHTHTHTHTHTHAHTHTHTHTSFMQLKESWFELKLWEESPDLSIEKLSVTLGDCWKMNMIFGTWNVRSLYRAGALGLLLAR